MGNIYLFLLINKIIEDDVLLGNCFIVMKGLLIVLRVARAKI